MRKTLILATVAALSLAAPAFAQTPNSAGGSQPGTTGNNTGTGAAKPDEQ